MVTIDGVVLAPSLFSTILGSPASIKAIAEKVVPKSIPRIFDIFFKNYLIIFTLAGLITLLFSI